METVLHMLIMGLVATALIDLWATFSSRVLKLPRTNWAMVGRWLGHLPSGRLVHNPISEAPGIDNELLLGWVFHYFIGVTYAAIYTVIVYAIMGSEPTALSAWVFGLVTVLSPWFILQPCLGLGVFASKTPKPNLVRMNNVIVHSIFGVGLYLGWVLAIHLI